MLVRDHDSKVFQPKYLDYCVVQMKGTNQVLMKDNHGHETKVHRRDLKVIDSDIKITELYAELRALGTRDTQHCMPVKQIPDLGWKKPEEHQRKKKPEPTPTQREGPVLRSSKKLTTVTEVEVETAATKVENREQISSKFLTVAVTTTAAMLYTAACKLIETNLF